MTPQQPGWHKGKFILDAFFSVINMWFVCLRRSTLVRNHLGEKHRSFWLVIFLSFNVFYCMWSNEWNQHNSLHGDWKNCHKSAAPFQFIFLGLPCILYKQFQPLPTSTPHNITILSLFYLDLWPHLCLFSNLASHSFFLIPLVCFFLLFYLNTLLTLQAHPVTWIIDTLINRGFALWQKGVGYPSGSMLIAKWEPRWKL